MLNLIVQSAKPEVCQRVRSDISGREDLLSELIHLAVALQNEHPLMIGRKDGAHIQAEKRLMHQNESYPLPHPEEREHYAKVDQEVNGHGKRLDDGKSRSFIHQEREAVDAYGEALQQQHREKQTGLVLYDAAAKSLRSANLFIREGEEPEPDIRVPFDMIGMSVMLVVRLDPSAIADGSQQVAKQAKGISLPRGLKNLPVTSVMPHECNLSERKREKRGIQNLHPEEIRRDEAAKWHNEETRILKNFAGVIDRLPVEQSLLCEEPLHLGILMCVRVGLHPAKPLELMLRGEWRQRLSYA